MEKSDTDKLIQDNFRQLSRSLMQSSLPDAIQAHKNLYEIGQPVKAILKEKLLEIDWSNSKYKELTKYTSGLFSLLYDIDENEAHIVGDKIISSGCPDHIRAIIESAYVFSVINYKRYNIKGIEIFEHKLINSKCDIGSYLSKWLNNVQDRDLEEIDRIYVIMREKISAAGTYTPVLKIIALLWENKHKKSSFLFKFNALFTEKVLYHEIGHHADRHHFGTDPDQEKKADTYAFQIMSKSHPYLAILMKLLSKLGFKSKRNYYRWGL